MDDSNLMIDVQNLTKIFSKKSSLRENFRETLSGFFKRKEDTENHVFRALDNISFSVNRGEVLGIMGVNGSGKSTLLKILSGITLPDSGKAVLNGSVSSILEIGTGFHPDLTGRDNIYLTGALLGIDSKTLEKKFDKIVTFSEIANFIDTPVKYYSSGMFVRLAFSIISELKSDIILLDEVMAVGDSAFSLKSFDKIRELSESGKTIVMVSHNPSIIMQLCEKCMILNKGKMVAFGKTSEIVSDYVDKTIKKRNRVSFPDNSSNNSQLPDWIKSSHLKSIEVHQEGRIKKEYSNTLPIELSFVIEKKERKNIRIALAFNHQLSIPVFSATPARATNPNLICSNYEPGIYKYQLDFPKNYFNQGVFTVDIYLTDDNDELIEKLTQVAYFKIRQVDDLTMDNNFNFLGTYPGPLIPVLEWHLEKKGIE
ncbi:MAG: ABC transporter ATP-binding protein [Chitinophagales bacterium]|nr:ABC transporter ATP-binding protein [Chitinophagales bacterium]